MPGSLEELERKLTETTDLLREREREIAELNHRISNSLQLVSTFLRLQRRRLRDPAAVAALDDATARIEGVARLHRTLRLQSGLALVDFGQYLKTIGPELSTSTGLDCLVEAEPVTLDSKTAISLAVAMNELVINAGKHAYGGKPGGAVEITCRRSDSGDLVLSVADHGRGLPAGFSPEESHSLGLSYVTGIAGQLGGSVETASNGGACFTIRVPLQPAQGDRAS